MPVDEENTAGHPATFCREAKMMIGLTLAQIETLTRFLRPLRSEAERRVFLETVMQQISVRDVDLLDACARAASLVNASAWYMNDSDAGP
jgi:hypothetical protein